MKENIAKTIKERRKELKLKQSDMQDYADIAPSTYSELENAKGNIILPQEKQTTFSKSLFQKR